MSEDHKIRPRQLDKLIEQKDLYSKSIQVLERLACWSLGTEWKAYGEVRDPAMTSQQAKVAMFFINKFIPDEAVRRALELQGQKQQLDINVIRMKFREAIAKDINAIQNLIGDDYVIVPRDQMKTLEISNQ